MSERMTDEQFAIVKKDKTWPYSNWNAADWMIAERAKVEELEAWIEQEGERGDICTFNILRKVCSYCQCKRKKEQGDE